MTWVLVLAWTLSPGHTALTLVEYPTAAICEQAREAVKSQGETKCVKMPSDPMNELRSARKKS